MKPDIKPEQIEHILKKDSDFEKLLDAYHTLFETYLTRTEADYDVDFSETHITNISGLGVSRHKVQGIEQDHVGLCVLLRMSTQEIKGVPNFPKDINGIPIYAEVVGHAEPSAFTARVRPAPGGYSVCNLNDSAGTLGCVVSYGSKTGILSNWHVLYDVKGNGAEKTVTQPGPHDGGAAPADTIATLKYAVPPVFIASAYGEVDAAIGEVSDTANVSKKLAKTSSVTYAIGAGTLDPVEGMEVQKSGRTTEYTVGKIKKIGVTQDIGPYANGKTGHFTNIFTVEGTSGTWGAGGDSGSLVTRKSDAVPVGLHFADGGGLGYECEIKKVLSALSTSAGTVTIQTG